MKLDVSIAGDIVALMRAELAAGEKAVTTTMNEAGKNLKAAWRAQITGAGLGQRLANTIRSQTYPIGDNSLNAAALVWANAPEIVGAHDTGPLIRSASGSMLAIPLPAAGTGRGGKHLTPKEWEQQKGMKLRAVIRPGKPIVLVAEGRINSKNKLVQSHAKVRRDGVRRGLVEAAIFIIVPQIKLRKRLNLARDADRAAAAIPGSIVRNWVEGHL